MVHLLVRGVLALGVSHEDVGSVPLRWCVHVSTFFMFELC